MNATDQQQAPIQKTAVSETHAAAYQHSDLERQHDHYSSQQAGRLAMYDELTAVLAHEINNPIYAARLALELLEQDLDSLGTESAYLTIATDGLRRVSAIIERLRRAIHDETMPAPHSSLEGLIAEAERGQERTIPPE